MQATFDAPSAPPAASRSDAPEGVIVDEAAGPIHADARRGSAAPGGDRWEGVVGLALAALIALVFVVSNPSRHNFYEHFTWQAAAWLEGQAGIRYPVCPSSGEPTFEGTTCAWRAGEGQPYNDFYLDVLPVAEAGGRPSGRALIPFPPLPALVLAPLVALWGVATDAQTLAALIGGLDVWLAWWLLGALRPSLRIRATATVFFGLGTVFWYTSMLGTTWYFAHVVAVGLTIVALGVALRADRPAVDEARVAAGVDDTRDGHRRSRGLDLHAIASDVRAGLAHGPWTLIDRRQFLAGFVLGLAATARLTIVFGLPFLAFVGGGGSVVRRGFSAGLGAALPVLALVVYNLITTGHVFHPAYEYLYQREAIGYPELGYNPAWSIEDLRYVPGNLWLMLAGTPDILPSCPPGDVRGLFSLTCPFAIPRSVGTSLLLTSPALLLAIPILLRIGRARLIAGAAIAVGGIAFVNLMHFSQGWVQFGYRFSNDFAPFALILVALAMIRVSGVRSLVGLLVAVSIVVNAWGVAWGVILGW